jgi:hypothetical protein
MLALRALVLYGCVWAQPTRRGLTPAPRLTQLRSAIP